MAGCQAVTSVPPMSGRERFYSANETLEEIALALNGIPPEVNPDPADPKSPTESCNDSYSDGSCSLGDPEHSEAEVPQIPQISIPNNTISAKITFEVPNPDGRGTKTIDFPLDIDLRKPPKPPQMGQLPTYEVNIPVLMGDAKVEAQEMTRTVQSSESSQGVPRKESNDSTCSFRAWRFGSCCEPRATTTEKPVPIIEHPPSDVGKFQNQIFEQWPTGYTESSLHEWVPSEKTTAKSVRPEGVPPLAGIKNIQVRAGASDQAVTPDYASTNSVTSWVENIFPSDQTPRKGSICKKGSIQELVLKPIGPETHSQQGFARFPGPIPSKTTAPKSVGLDELIREPTWVKAKSLESPGRTGGYGETAVDAIPEDAIKEEKPAPVPIVKTIPKKPTVDPYEPRGALTARSGTSIVEGVAAVGRKISEGLQSIARKLTFSPISEIGVPESEDPFTPGIGWVPRPDEVGEGVRTIEELQKLLNGTWVQSTETSDSMEPALDVLEMPWLLKRAVMYATQTEIKVLEDRVYVSPKLLGITAPQESFFGREGRMQPRRDRRKGLSRIACVPTKKGLRQYNQWGEPYQGISLLELEVDDEGKNLTTKLTIKRRTGQSATVRAFLKKRIS